MSLLAQLKARIAAQGPLSIAEYMEAAATQYYATRDPFGAQGDFTTAPEISQIFGELLGAWVADQWQRAGSPHATLLELGPGRGTLMKDALRATKHVPDFHARLQVAMVETSPTLTALQQKTLHGVHPCINWHTTLESALQPAPFFFIANEFFDALPIRQFIGEQERMVEWKNERFTPMHGTVTREVCELAQAIMHALAQHIARHGGAGIIVDYGYTGGSTKDTLQALERHAYADPFAHPGEADITAHVDFDALADAARTGGAQAHGPYFQGEFLLELGAQLRLQALCARANAEQRAQLESGFTRLVAPEQMGMLFKVLLIIP